MPEIILASQSKARAILLKELVADFEIKVSGVDETLDATMDIYNALKQLAFRKADKIYRNNPNSVVIAADTVVYQQGQVIGKPQDASDALRILAGLVGKSHCILTAVALCSKYRNYNYVEEAVVTFQEVSAHLLKLYIQDYPVFEKAGSYSLWDDFVVNHFKPQVIGEKETVIGLPLLKLRHYLKEVLND